jgi:hypothetical protein
MTSLEWSIVFKVFLVKQMKEIVEILVMKSFNNALISPAIFWTDFQTKKPVLIS